MVRLMSGRNVNWTWPAALKLLDECGAREDSRAGPVVAAPWPVVTVYEQPTERVLLDPARDANPFFHLFEAIWMLAGRQDGTWLDTYVRDFSSRYAEADGTIHGAYGHRWRRHFDVDQLAVVADRLRRDPRDRRAVIQMWDPVSDLTGPDAADPVVGRDGRVHEELVWPEEPRDVPCNTAIYPRVRDLVGGAVLDLTVSCRSNDVVWGLCGANAVHFSVMQEWLAAAVGARVGRMYTLSNNYHAYVSELERVRQRAARGGYWHGHLPSAPPEEYPGTEPMVTVPHEFLRDAERWCAAENPTAGVYGNSWFAHVAAPLWHAHRYWRGGDYAAASYELDDCLAPDWRLAAQRWLARRQERAEGREQK